MRPYLTLGSLHQGAASVLGAFGISMTRLNDGDSCLSGSAGRKDACHVDGSRADVLRMRLGRVGSAR